eukprot:g78429.t1
MASFRLEGYACRQPQIHSTEFVVRDMGNISFCLPCAFSQVSQVDEQGCSSRFLGSICADLQQIFSEARLAADLFCRTRLGEALELAFLRGLIRPDAHKLPLLPTLVLICKTHCNLLAHGATSSNGEDSRTWGNRWAQSMIAEMKQMKSRYAWSVFSNGLVLRFAGVLVEQFNNLPPELCFYKLQQAAFFYGLKDLVQGSLDQLHNPDTEADIATLLFQTCRALLIRRQPTISDVFPSFASSLLQLIRQSSDVAVKQSLLATWCLVLTRSQELNESEASESTGNARGLCLYDYRIGNREQDNPDAQACDVLKSMLLTNEKLQSPSMGCILSLCSKREDFVQVLIENGVSEYIFEALRDGARVLAQAFVDDDEAKCKFETKLKGCALLLQGGRHLCEEQQFWKRHQMFGFRSMVGIIDAYVSLFPHLSSKTRITRWPPHFSSNLFHFCTRGVAYACSFLASERKSRLQELLSEEPSTTGANLLPCAVSLCNVLRTFAHEQFPFDPEEISQREFGEQLLEALAGLLGSGLLDCVWLPGKKRVGLDAFTNLLSTLLEDSPRLSFEARLQIVRLAWNGLQESHNIVSTFCSESSNIRQPDTLVAVLESLEHVISRQLTTEMISQLIAPSTAISSVLLELDVFHSICKPELTRTLITEAEGIASALLIRLLDAGIVTTCYQVCQRLGSIANSLADFLSSSSAKVLFSFFSLLVLSQANPDFLSHHSTVDERVYELTRFMARRLMVPGGGFPSFFAQLWTEHVRKAAVDGTSERPEDNIDLSAAFQILRVIMMEKLATLTESGGRGGAGGNMSQPGGLVLCSLDMLQFFKDLFSWIRGKLLMLLRVMDKRAGVFCSLVLYWPGKFIQLGIRLCTLAHQLITQLLALMWQADEVKLFPPVPAKDKALSVLFQGALATQYDWSVCIQDANCDKRKKFGLWTWVMSRFSSTCARRCQEDMILCLAGNPTHILNDEMEQMPLPAKHPNGLKALLRMLTTTMSDCQPNGRPSAFLQKLRSAQRLMNLVALFDTQTLLALSLLGAAQQLCLLLQAVTSFLKRPSSRHGSTQSTEETDPMLTALYQVVLRIFLKHPDQARALELFANVALDILTDNLPTRATRCQALAMHALRRFMFLEHFFWRSHDGGVLQRIQLQMSSIATFIQQVRAGIKDLTLPEDKSKDISALQIEILLLLAALMDSAVAYRDCLQVPASLKAHIDLAQFCIFTPAEILRILTCHTSLGTQDAALQYVTGLFKHDPRLSANPDEEGAWTWQRVTGLLDACQVAVSKANISMGHGILALTAAACTKHVLQAVSASRQEWMESLAMRGWPCMLLENTLLELEHGVDAQPSLAAISFLSSWAQMYAYAPVQSDFSSAASDVPVDKATRVWVYRLFQSSVVNQLLKHLPALLVVNASDSRGQHESKSIFTAPSVGVDEFSYFRCIKASQLVLGLLLTLARCELLDRSQHSERLDTAVSLARRALLNAREQAKDTGQSEPGCAGFLAPKFSELCQEKPCLCERNTASQKPWSSSGALSPLETISQQLEDLELVLTHL